MSDLDTKDSSAEFPAEDPVVKKSGDGKDGRRALVAAYLGSTVEFYDFLLYSAAAALVFPTVFFSSLPTATAITLSYVTLATGYVARPIGGILFGHFGDKVGRKRMLLITMVIMGIVSIAIGLLPAGVGAAAFILVLLRVIQGIAVGGEWAGAALIAMEHAKPKRRGFAASVAVSGGPSGAVLSTVIFGLFATLPEDAFLSWGWRVPFLLSAVIVVIAIFLRTRVPETPVFEDAVAKGAVATPDGTSPVAKHNPVPILEILRRYPGRVAIAITAGLAPLFLQSLLATFGLQYATASGLDRSTVLWAVSIASFFQIFSIPAFAVLSDRLGRRKVILMGYGLSVFTIWPTLFLIGQGEFLFAVLGFVIGNTLTMSFIYGPMGAWFAEMFNTRTRYTGVSLGYQVSAALGAGFAPVISTGLLAATGGVHPYLIGVFFVGLVIAGSIVVFISKERAGTLES